MGRRVFKTPEEKEAWKAHVSAYNKRYKESSAYQDYIKEFKSGEDYKKRQREYQSKRWRSKKIKRVRKSPEFKAKQTGYQKKFYSDAENKQARAQWVKAYQQRPEIKDKKNAAKRWRRKASGAIAKLCEQRARKLRIDEAVNVLKIIDRSRINRIYHDRLARLLAAKEYMKLVRQAIGEIRERENLAFKKAA